MAKKSKGRIGVVYSTDPDYTYSEDRSEQTGSVSPEDQKLRIYLDRKNRKGKEVTIVDNFVGEEEDLKDLGKLLKKQCGTGGSVKDGQVIIQGDFRQKIMQILSQSKYGASIR